MFCRYCGAEIPDGSRFCIRCGAVLTEENGRAMSGASEIENGMDAGRNGGGQEQIPDSRQLSAGAGSGQTDQNQGNQAFGQTSGSNQKAEKPYMSAESQNSASGSQGNQFRGDGQYSGSGNQGEQSSKGLGRNCAVASLVLGIISIVTVIWFAFVGLSLGVLSLLLAEIAKAKGDRSGIRTGGMACSGVGIVLGIFRSIVSIILTAMSY